MCVLRYVCVCVCFCQNPVTPAVACCDWDMVPLGSPVEIYGSSTCIATAADLYTCALATHVQHGAAFSFSTLCNARLFLWKRERKPLATFKLVGYIETVFLSRGKTAIKVELNVALRNVIYFRWFFNTFMHKSFFSSENFEQILWITLNQFLFWQKFKLRYNHKVTYFTINSSILIINVNNKNFWRIFCYLKMGFILVKF